METNKLYIDKLLSLSKASAQEPFLAEWLPLYGTEPRRVYLADLYREQGQSYKEMDILQAGTRLQTILDLLLPSTTTIWRSYDKSLSIAKLFAPSVAPETGQKCDNLT